MRSKKLMIKVMTGLIAAGLSLSAVVSVSAKSTDATVNNNKTPITQTAKGDKRVVFGENIKTQLDTLVKTGTITQAQSDKIVEFINEKNEARKTEMEKVKNMTEEQRKSYFENNKSTEKSGLLKELVDKGIINQEQADKLKTSIPEKKGPGKGMEHGGKMNAEGIKATLDALVKSGKLTQVKEDKIISFMKEKDEARKTEMEKIKNMTEEQRKAYFENNKSKEKTNLFKELVNNGTLTQAEVDAIKAALPKMEKPKNKNIDANTNKTVDTKSSASI